jgi:DNA-binding transcriptional LysR family regulator
LINEFYAEFADVELIIRTEVYNGVWDALVTGRADIAIGATSAIPVDGQFDYKEMGDIEWAFIVAAQHDLSFPGSDLSDSKLMNYPAICVEDTSASIPQRATWVLPKQRKLVVASWEQALGAAKSGAGIGYVPKHIAQPYIDDGSLTQIILPHPKAPSACCLAWNTVNQSPALTWVLTYLGDMDRLHDQWMNV